MFIDSRSGDVCFVICHGKPSEVGKKGGNQTRLGNLQKNYCYQEIELKDERQHQVVIRVGMEPQKVKYRSP